jgi:hypothetical protein
MKKWLSIVALLLAPVFAQAQWTTHGFTIPASHPRLYWNSSRIAASQKWLAAHPFTDANTPSNDPDFVRDVGMKHVLTGADCSTATTWATGWAPAAIGNGMTNGNNDWRWYGEDAILAYDWCHDQWTSGQIATFVTNMNTWVEDTQTAIWGRRYSDGTWMTQNNFYLSYLRNELEWGIVSYGETGQSNATADGFIDDAINTLWAHRVSDAAPGGPAAGGVPMEGPGYGGYQGWYPIIPLVTISNMGRDLLAGDTFQRDFTYWSLYWTTPAPTAVRDDGGASKYELTGFSDFLEDTGGALWSTNYAEDWFDFYAQYAATNYPTTPLAGYARQWLSTIGPVASLSRDPTDTSLHNYYISNYLISNDPGGSATSYSSLPLDYWATGSQYGVSKTAWDTSSTVVTYFIGTSITNIEGHEHQDNGSFSMWRGGYWVMRNDVGYQQTIAGTPNVASGTAQNISPSSIANNTILFSNVEMATASQENMMPSIPSGQAVTDRLSSQSAYFYLDTDLSALYKWESGHSGLDPQVASHVEREFIYVRSLETLVVLDRILTHNQVNGGSLTAAQVATSFVTHYEVNPTIVDSNHYTATNGTQILRQTVLVPSSATYRVINEASCSGCSSIGQYRVEVDNSGAAQRYSLDVLQSSASGTAAVIASVVDSNPSNPSAGTLTVTLQPGSGSATTIVFNKGEKSSGGTINVAAAGAANLPSGVENISYTVNGPLWGGPAPPTGVSGTVIVR